MLVWQAVDGKRGGKCAVSLTSGTNTFLFDPGRDLFNPFAPGVMDDPYPYYAALRDNAPVHHNPQLGMYFLSRYEDVLQADRDITRFARGQQARAYDGNTAAVRVLFANNLFAQNPPEHTRLKRLFSSAFTRTLIEGMRPRIEELCRQVLDEANLAPGGGHFDLVGGFSHPFPSLVICGLCDFSWLRERSGVAR